MDSIGSETVASVFDKVARARLHDVAVIYDGQSATYAELNSRANSIASGLRKLGLDQLSSIAILLPRSTDLIATILGVVKAGMVYVPLDAQAPLERIRRVFRSADCQLVITSTDGRAKLIDFPCCEVDELERAGRGAVAFTETAALVDMPLYINYTSGSTGSPKGVIVRHVNVLNLVREQHYCELGPGVKVLHLANVAFDATTFEIWGPLLNGGVVVVCPEQSFSLATIASVLRRYQVDIAFLTTSLFNLVVDSCPSAFEPLKQVLTGGEIMSATHVKRLAEQYPGLRITNVYGPTECTTFSTYHDVQVGDCQAANVPIGRPIENTVVQVMDDQNALVPIGGEGEIWIGGRGVSSGYINNPALTSDVFIFLPHGTFYRTGDLGRVGRSGNIEYIGRSDDQVKVRGFRIELAEVLSGLLRCAAIDQAYVSVELNPRNEKVLVAYVVGLELEGGRISSQLASILPAYMIPSEIYRVHQIPLGPTGKADHGQLIRNRERKLVLRPAETFFGPGDNHD
ncbi:amino acid adenylation domain-containing protein [Pseudomonas eucalypticola]|uniref:Amino acid adenylation domain-containing protein n=1 Tax=Pseudomonas eucalypticola TaxID=2599595 RepID=A0A7D5HEG3_9PSED|nr:amino acid adenylation domain-containing protein [Pseudomonas eucalypticola]QKZ03346.1 amino acid adenylation domain-containing protein [Pseudomonas eucalypticola]